MVCACAVVLMVIGFLFARPLLTLFGASADAMVYAYPYMMLYLIGTLPSMIATGMNPFINAQGYSTVGMLSVTIGAVANLLLDPLFIFVLGFGVQGAAIATVISQTLSAVFVLYFLTRKAELCGLCKKYRQPRNGRFYHAAHQQPCYHLLQQRAFRDRRRYLHICYDNCIKCPSARRDPNLCDE